MTPVCSSATAAAPPSAGGWLSTRAQIVMGGCACAAATAFLYEVDPSRHAVYPQCLLYNTTGIYCAGCGATRAFYALLHGRVLEAMRDNVLFVAVLPVMLYLVGSRLLTAWRENKWAEIQMSQRTFFRAGGALFFALVLFMVLRNLPGWPFEWLRPV